MTPVEMPDPDDAAALVAEAEAFLAARRPDLPPETPAEGETRQVRRLRAEVAEAHQLADLQDDDTPLLLDSPKVRRRRKAAHEAARLHRLAQDPTMRAWTASRMRRLLVAAALVSLTLALGWSTAGVQVFAAEGAADWSARWLFAWLVEPFLSLALLTVVGAKAYMGTRGQPIRSTTLTRIEALFLALTLGMNAWPHLPGIAAKFTLTGLVLHVLGPVVAVAIVTALPIILAAFARLNHDQAATVRPGQIDPDQERHDAETAAGDRVGSAAAARRAIGAENRARVTAYVVDHPDATVEQIATALGLSVTTVKRHRRAARSGE